MVVEPIPADARVSAITLHWPGGSTVASLGSGWVASAVKDGQPVGRWATDTFVEAVRVLKNALSDDQ